MTKTTLNDLVNLENQTSAVNIINANNETIEVAFDNTLSRDGTSPNQMESVLDMNSNRIINLVDPVSTSEPITLSYLNFALSDVEAGLGTLTPVSAAMAPVVNATTRPVGKGLLGLAANAYTFDTRTLAAATNIPVGTTSVSTLGFSSAGDGGDAIYTLGVAFTPGGFQSADGQWWTMSTDMLNVKAFGAKGDYSAITTTGTNDTAAFNLAIAEQGLINNTKKIYLPRGNYAITPGSLSILVGSLYGPEAQVIAATNQDSPIFRIYYRDNGEEISGETFTLLAIHGYGYFFNNITHGYDWPNRLGTAIYAIACDRSKFDVKEIAGFSINVWLDGGSNDLHQGVNQFYFQYLHHGVTGIFMNQGSIPNSQQEDNYFRIAYMQNFTGNCIYLGGGGTLPLAICQNVFDIGSMTPNQPNANAIVCTQYAYANKFTVRSWDAGVSGTGLVVLSAGLDNLFQVPYADFNTNVSSIGNDIWDLSTNVTDGTGRSQITATAPPASGNWRRGDITWNITPVAAGTPGWMCVGAGTPGTWKAMANLAA